MDQWTSSNEPHRIKGLDKGKYILTEINVVGDYMTANNNYTYEIEAGINKYDVLAIKHIKKGNVINQRPSNVLTTGKKEYINDELFVLKLRDCYVNRMNNKDFIVDDNNKNIDVDKWYKKQAKIIFKKHLDEIYKTFSRKIVYPELRIRKMTTRWGVCNTKTKVITLNLELIKRDEKYLDYVIVHELSHLIYPNHSSKFWELVEENFPKYKQIKKEMKEF